MRANAVFARKFKFLARALSLGCIAAGQKISEVAFPAHFHSAGNCRIFPEWPLWPNGARVYKDSEAQFAGPAASRLQQPRSCDFAIARVVRASGDTLRRRFWKAFGRGKLDAGMETPAPNFFGNLVHPKMGREIRWNYLEREFRQLAQVSTNRNCVNFIVSGLMASVYGGYAPRVRVSSRASVLCATSAVVSQVWPAEPLAEFPARGRNTCFRLRVECRHRPAVP